MPRNRRIPPTTKPAVNYRRRRNPPQVQNPPGTGRRSRARAAAAARLARRPAAIPETENFPGNVAFDVERPVAARRSAVAEIRGLETLPPRCVEFVHRHLNPCTEMVTFTENSKVPDGALPNSTVLELREVLIVRPPNSTANVEPLTGAMWTLTIVHLPLFRTPLILHASMANAEMSGAVRNQLIVDWNSSEFPPEYPEWKLLTGQTQEYWCVVKWKMLLNIDPPTENGTRAIQQFRITCDGMTIFDNTPDLVNQGMVVGAQWPTNMAKRSEMTRSDLAGFEVEFRHVTGASSISTMPGAVMAWQYPVDIGTAVFTQVSGTGSNLYPISQQDNYPYDRVAIVMTLTAASATVVANTSHEFSVTVPAGTTTVVPRGTQLTFSSQREASGSWIVSVSALIDSAAVVIMAASGAQISYQQNGHFTEEMEFPSITTFQLPPTDTQNIIQTTPKAVYMSAKEQNGVYMVKRVFQPVFNVQEANERRQVVMIDPNVSDTYLSFAPADVFDLNFGVGVTVWTSIPTACAPAIKLVRDVEIVAGQDGPFMGFMKSNQDKCEAALEIVRAMSVHHPFLYPESYNVLGSLVGMISNVVGKVPILGNVVNAVGGIVKGILGTESQPASGSSQNRLASTNVEEIAKLIPLIMNQLNIG